MNLKKISIDILLIFFIFLVDRVSKIYIIKISEIESKVDIYLTEYLNFYLIWNKGVAFGLFSFNESFIYNSITLIIELISIILGIMIYNNNEDLSKKIINLKHNKKLCNQLSKKSLKFAKKFEEKKVFLEYLKIINFNKKHS